MDPVAQNHFVFALVYLRQRNSINFRNGDAATFTFERRPANLLRQWGDVANTQKLREMFAKMFARTPVIDMVFFWFCASSKKQLAAAAGPCAQVLL